VREGFELREELYLIGSMERGVTVYGQQVRAHNLMWALSERDKVEEKEPQSIAIVGGGIAGLTAAACALELFPRANVILFERSLDLCSLQQGCDTRWLHPRVYDWPAPGSRAPSASLPVLNWWEGRASDVADQILRRFARHVARHTPQDNTPPRLRIYLDVAYLTISGAPREIEWVGRAGDVRGPFVRAGRPVGESEAFDRIVLAVGFGAETHAPGFPTPWYWRNDQIAHPRLDGFVRPYVVSGYGDGALIDLCRLTIERFRQDRILYDVFADELSEAEQRLLRLYYESVKGGEVFQAFRDLEKEGGFFARARDALRARIRKDTRVLLHLRGGGTEPNTALADVFGNTSSFANRTLLYLLYRCGAFTPHVGTREDALREHDGPPEHVISRYGPRTRSHVLSNFRSAPDIESSLERLRVCQPQVLRREWEPGSIPHYASERL
jgi:hypothetical protein